MLERRSVFDIPADPAADDAGDSIFIGVAEPIAISEQDAEMSKKDSGPADKKSKRKKKNEK